MNQDAERLTNVRIALKFAYRKAAKAFPLSRIIA